MAAVALPYVVVLNIQYAGYGVVRSLVPYNVPVVAFQNDMSIPEAQTSLCESVIHFDNEGDLLEKLVGFSAAREHRPVLLLTSDVYIEFFVKHRQTLETYFLIDFPRTETVKLLLHKNKFSAYAEKTGILIPKTGELKTDEDLESIDGAYSFPVALKPSRKSEAWRKAKLPKLFHVHSIMELRSLYHEIRKIEREFIVQEWIPGPDSNVYYCLVYFNGLRECIMAFTGLKIRQWPVGTGSTATTIPVENEWIRNETIKIFRDLDYMGFGSIEYKQHEDNGRYYIMEPTVGRLNQQEYVATVNGANIPLAAYSYLTGRTIRGKKAEKGPIIYIDEWAELYSVAVHLKRRLLTLRQWLNSIQGRRAYRFWSKDDKKVFLASVYASIKSLFNPAKWKLLMKS